MKSSAEILARNIKKLRQEKDLTATQLAILGKTTSSVITALESGEANPTLKRIDAIALALNVSSSELLQV